MNIEQVEAWCLDRAKDRRLFAALGAGDYLLTEEELLTLIRVAHKAGVVSGAGVMTRMVTDACNAAGGGQKV